MKGDEGIRVAEGVRIRRLDACNWAIERSRMSRKGQPCWDVVGYYPGPGAAAEALVQRHVELLLSPLSVATVRELIQALERLQARLRGELERWAESAS